MDQSQLQKDLIKAISDGNFSLVRQCVENGADVNDQNAKPMKAAIDTGSLDIVDFFVQKRCQIFNPKFEIYPYLQKEASQNPLLRPIVSYLVKHGVKFTKTNEDDKLTHYIVDQCTDSDLHSSCKPSTVLKTFPLDRMIKQLRLGVDDWGKYRRRIFLKNKGLAEKNENYLADALLGSLFDSSQSTDHIYNIAFTWKKKHWSAGSTNHDPRPRMQVAFKLFVGCINFLTDLDRGDIFEAFHEITQKVDPDYLKFYDKMWRLIFNKYLPTQTKPMGAAFVKKYSERYKILKDNDSFNLTLPKDPNKTPSR